MSTLLERVRRAIGGSNAPITFRISLKREPDADRDTYTHRVEEIVDDLEASIRGAGSFDSLRLSRTAGPYGRVEQYLDRDEHRITELRAELATREETGPSLMRLFPGRTDTNELRNELDQRMHSYEKLRTRQPRAANVFVYEVDFEPVSNATCEVVISEFNRLTSLGGVATVETERTVPSDDSRDRLEWGG